MDGMDVLDIGGESTRPGYTKLSDQEEIDRVAPIIEAVKARFDVPVSLDTYKSAVDVYKRQDFIRAHAIVFQMPQS